MVQSGVRARRHDTAVSLIREFDDQAARTPGLPAVDDGARVLTYRELREWSERLAVRLLECDAAPRARAAILAHPGAQAIVAILAALRADKIYVPLQPGAGTDWNADVLKRAGATLLLADADSEARAGEIARTLPACGVVRIAPERTGAVASVPAPPATAEDPCYLVFTSGTTGEPKGVLQTSGNVLRSAREFARILGVRTGDRVSHFTPLTFGNATNEIFGALLTGASLHARDLGAQGIEGMPEWLERNGVSVYHSVPTILRRICRAAGTRAGFPAVRVVCLGAEPVFSGDVELVRRYFPGAERLVHTMGASETKLTSALVLEPPFRARGDILPVGFPVAGVEIYVAGEDGRDLGRGPIGEICIRGRHLSPGYWNDAELTRERFVADPEDPGTRIYRSGDLGRVGDDGCLEFLGRRDGQIKIDGQGVNLIAIESALNALPELAEAAVTTGADETGIPRIEAYVVPAEGSQPSVAELRARLGAVLPARWVPARYFRLSGMPVGANGKIDRSVLRPDRARSMALGTPHAEPGTRRERVLGAMFEEVLNRAAVGRDDNFFDLGGDSLRAADLMGRIGQFFGIRLGVEALIAAPTVAALAALLAARGEALGEAGGTGMPLTCLREGGAKPPMFIFPGGQWDDFTVYFIYRRLLPHLDAGRAVYAVAAPPSAASAGSAPDIDPDIDPNIEEFTRDRLREVERICPSGPVHLVGFCSGAIAAHAAARALGGPDRRAVTLVLVDPLYPSGAFGWWSWQLRSAVNKHVAFLREAGARARLHLREADLRHPLRAARAMAAKFRLAGRLYEPYSSAIRRIGADRFSRALVRHRLDSGVRGVHIIVSEDRRARRRAKRWIRRVGAPASYRSVPGDHRTHVRAHVAEVARAISTVLDG